MPLSLPRSLEPARVQGLPSTAYYVHDFISDEEERLILAKIASAPKPSWKQLSHRRLQSWPFPLLNDKLIDAPLPSWLQDAVVPRLLSLPRSEGGQHVFAQSPHARPNHVLVNEYPPGDGAAYWPVVCTVSLGASLCLDVYRSNEDGSLDATPAWRILQEPRSLLITTDGLYTDYLHGIADIGQDVDLGPGGIVNWSLLGNADAYADGSNVRGIRTSLTYRDVVHVSKAGSKLGLGRGIS
ncbi:hypothetical protein L249_6488 [Ophiocordyceps polyrhachis-furcata BCC 54312]|uniref:Fe2OG dioxygenase domain-containing protein n=1 Tax=Ophiocordyceps polyrhachis-furcata BCC 54312 TaxID=1330021 RepID=A0A367LM09_9HYPO|nr:hypothetical protein L249_6488 [Ophiocordyceps polyrhachis-furcata BCC 54312]